MSHKSSLHQLRDACTPTPAQHEAVRKRVMQRIEEPAFLREAKHALTPPVGSQHLFWRRILERLSPVHSTSLLGRLVASFSPQPDQMERIRQRILSRLQPQTSRWSLVPLTTHGLKWASAFVIIVIVLQMSPALLFTQHTVAESAVLAVPTRGSMSMLMHGFWQPIVEELTIKEGGAQFRTSADSAMTIMLHDDGNVRLGSEAAVMLHDVSDRPEPAVDGPTLTLTAGQLWLQGLLPEYLRGITISTPHGDVVIHGGSVAIAVFGESVDVRVFDGHAFVHHDGQATQLVAGERTALRADGAPVIVALQTKEYDDQWVSQNLGRDAVHRKEIAQWQQERRAAQAGILPTSPLYQVKRVAERVDVLLTFDGEQKLRKQLDQASTRLDEAAALIAQGDSSATVPLEEYRTTLISLASGTGSDSSATQFLIRQEVAENSAQLSATAPSDDLYELKKAVLEAGASLPDQVIDQSDVQGTLLVDTLGAAKDAVVSGDLASAHITFDELKPLLDALNSTGSELKPAVRKEALSLINTLAVSLGEEALTATGSGPKELLKEVAGYLPPKPTQPIERLTDQEIDAMVLEMQGRIFLYKQPRARWNQLQYEMVQLRGHPDEGTLLRHLYHALPENGLAKYVRTEIQRLRGTMEDASGACVDGSC